MLSLIGAAAVVASLSSPPIPAPPVELIRSISSHPYAGLLRDTAGNFYGTTWSGGAFTAGNVFKLAPDGTYTSIYDFTGGSDGWRPVSDLVRDASGNFYGTTQLGGSGSCTCGVVFKVTPDGTETVLHSFLDGTDGSMPYAGVVMDANGNLYGTTLFGGGGYCDGVTGCGTVFELTPDGIETILHEFTCLNDGCTPSAGVILDKQGHLYGTTGSDGSSLGNVFETNASGAFKVLHAFAGSGDGIDPRGRLVRDTAGNLYGTTNSGGANGYGTVFRLAPDGTETILHSFSFTDGAYPYAGLIRDRKGDLYGTTAYGGGGSCDSRCGTVFKVSPDHQETTLHTFLGGENDGGQPLGVLLSTKNGNLYGTTYSGGVGDLGTVFVITP